MQKGGHEEFLLESVTVAAYVTQLLAYSRVRPALCAGGSVPQTSEPDASRVAFAHGAMQPRTERTRSVRNVESGVPFRIEMIPIIGRGGESNHLGEGAKFAL